MQKPAFAGKSWLFHTDGRLNPYLLIALIISWVFPNLGKFNLISTWTKVFRYFTDRSRRVCNPLCTLSPGCKPVESDAGKLMGKYLDRIREHDEPLADALAELVEAHRYDIIQDLFE